MSIAETGSDQRSAPARSEHDISRDQLRAIDAWTRSLRDAELVASGMSREARLDASRRSDVVRRQHQALLDWAARRNSGNNAARDTAPRAVLVHRNEWFKGKLAEGLRSDGFNVVAELENGADAVGVVIAEQPEVVLIEDKLPMISGEDVIREVRYYAPNTIIVAQVAEDSSVATFLDAGAHTAVTRRVPPAEVAAEVSALVAG